MKQNYTVFICDECGKSIMIEKNMGYPYEKGWVYIYNFTSKFLRLYTPGVDIDIAHVQEKDKHFCCEKCMFVHLRKIVKEYKKVKYDGLG